MNAFRFLHFIRVAMRCVCAAALTATAAEPAAPKPPDRRELWVPADKLGFVLDQNAVLLTREQYEVLLRDAEREKGPRPEAPASAIISSANYHAIPDGKTAVIRAELLVNVLRDGWCALPLDFQNAAIGAVKLDGEGVFTPRNPTLREEAPAPQSAQKQAPAERPALLILRGRGEHRVSLEMTAIIRAANDVSSLSVFVPGVAAGTFDLTLPAGTTMEKCGEAMRVSKTAEATTATVALSPAQQTVAFAWKAAIGGDAAKVPVRAQARVRYDIDAEKITGTFRLLLESDLGDLPTRFQIAFPAGVKVLTVRADELRGWEAANGKITATLQDGARQKAEVETSVELQPLIGKDSAATTLPLPVVEGVPRIGGLMYIVGADNVIIRDVLGDARLRRIPTAEDRGERGFFGAYEFSGASAAPRVTIQRTEPLLESDLDTLVEFRSDAIYLTRTLTLREQKGRGFSTAITLPAGEEFLDVRRIEEAKPVANQSSIPGLFEPGMETEPEWTREGAAISIKWSDEAAKPRVFRVRTRFEPEKWTQLPPEGVSFTLRDAKIAGVSRVTGYIALTADPAFRLEAQAGETLERRDGRSTPVRGEYAWFRREAFDLTVKIARRPSEVLAALTGYALPLEGVLDLRASMTYQFLGGGTRAVKLRVPKDIAQNFHFEGPQIAERALADDVWTVTFQKELTGAYALSIAAQVPVAKQAAQDGGKGYSFTAKVPVISPLDVVRSSGLWAVEANTETEIRFDARGMNELDSLLAPQLADYTPRHRVIGVFGWLGADYALTLSGVRHAPAGMLTAVVDTLELNTVISTSGTHRHEAVYRLRSTGVEYLDVTLPPGAQLLSVAIDGTAVKPVADRPGSVRLPLPARRDADAPVLASITYETAANAWQNRGTLALAAPSLAKEIPVLKSAWHVWVPDGFSYSEFESNLPVREEQAEEVLIKRIARIPFEASSSAFNDAAEMNAAWEEAERALEAQRGNDPSTNAIFQKLNSIRFPKVDFRETTVREAIKFIVDESKALDPDGQGVSIMVKLGGQGGGNHEPRPRIEIPGLGPAPGGEDTGTRITLTLNNVPMIEVVKYITNLANLKYKIEPSGVVIMPIGSQTGELKYRKWLVPSSLFREGGRHAEVIGNAEAKKFLERAGVTFGEGARAMYRPERNTLIVRNTDYQLDLTDRILEIAAANAAPSEMLNAGNELRRPSLPAKAVAMTSTIPTPNTTAITGKLNSIIFPKIDFRDATVREAIEFLVSKSKLLDQKREGVNIVLHDAAVSGNASRITLTLKNVPLIEVIKYVTNLANLKYKIEPFAVSIVPIGTQTEELFIKQWRVPPGLLSKRPTAAPQTANANAPGGAPNASDFLAASGVTFGQGAFAMYSPASNTLIVKGTQEQLDRIERIIADAETPAKPQAGKNDMYFDDGKLGRKTAGLLPVTLDLPRSGRVLVFEGLYAPERLVMRYDDWWSRARALWMWFVSGGIALWLLAGRRPWWRTLWAVLLLTAVPLCVGAAWTPVCNALLGGWLAGLVLNRLAALCVFRERKEVLA